MNETMLIRICKLIAMNYALENDDVWRAYQRLGSIDKLIELASTGTLDKLSHLN